jgi:Domain of unknown function (DUF4333)
VLVRNTLPAAACLVLLALAGCGKKLETDKIEVEVKKVLTDRTGIQIVSVTCPDDVDVKKGDTFRCTARPSTGKPLSIEVTQEDDEGRVTWKLVRQR